MGNVYRLTLAVLFGMWVLSCGNPVVPTGGPKDTSSPVLKHFSIDSTNKDYLVTLVFDENIAIKGPLKVSPISKIKTSVKRNTVNVEVSKASKTIFIQQSITDLNESNPYKGKNISLTKDSGIICLKNATKNNKVSLFIKEDSLIYIPQQIKEDYKFENLNYLESIITVIAKDNNNYTVDPEEEFLQIPIDSKNYGTRDTIKINFLYPRVKLFEKEIPLETEKSILKTKYIKTYKTGTTINNLICQNDSCIQSNGPTMDLLPKTTYCLIKNKDSIYLKERHSFSDSLFLINSPICFSKTKKSKYCIDLGKLIIKQNQNDSTYILLKSENNSFLIHITSGSDSIYIPVGKYQCYLSKTPFNQIGQASNTKSNKPITNHLLNQPPLYKFKEEILINSKLDNSLILPDYNKYNFGITFK